MSQELMMEYDADAKLFDLDMEAFVGALEDRNLRNHGMTA